MSKVPPQLPGAKNLNRKMVLDWSIWGMVAGVITAPIIVLTKYSAGPGMGEGFSFAFFGWMFFALVCWIVCSLIGFLFGFLVALTKFPRSFNAWILAVTGAFLIYLAIAKFNLWQREFWGW